MFHFLFLELTHGISLEPPSRQLLGTHLPVSLALFGKCLLVELQPRSLPRILTAHMRPASRPPFSRVFSEWGLGGHRENLCITREATEFCESSGHRPACVPVSALPLHSQPRLSIRHWTRTFSFLICKTGVLPTSLQGCEVNSYLLNTYHMPGTIPRLGDPVTGNSCCPEA